LEQLADGRDDINQTEAFVYNDSAATFSVVVMEYDGQNNLTAQSLPFEAVGVTGALAAYPPDYTTGNPNDPDPSFHPGDWQAVNTYDSLGDVTGSTRRPKGVGSL
jgi:hypothetical protein